MAKNIPPRIKAARDAIIKAGGPAAFSKTLSAYLGAPVNPKRIEQWRYRGIPDEWTTIIEHLTGIRREALNPHLYDVQVTHRVIHRKLTRENLYTTRY